MFLLFFLDRVDFVDVKIRAGINICKLICKMTGNEPSFKITFILCILLQRHVIFTE